VRRGTSLDGEDRDAFFENLARSGGAALVVLVRRIVGRQELAEEIVQEAYAKLALQTWEMVRAPQSWLRKVAVRLAIDEVRRAKRAAGVEVEPRAGNDVPDETAVPERAHLKQELDEQLAAAIAKLLPDQIQLVNLYYFQEMSAQQIASLLQISEGAVAHRLARILARCRALLTNVGVHGAELE